MTMDKLKDYLKKNGAVEVCFADISDVTPKKGLNQGVAFYITYPPEVILTIRDSPTRDYLNHYDWLNEKLDSLGELCKDYINDLGFRAYAQTTRNLGWDFGKDNSFELPHKTVATKAGLGWIGKSALFVTRKYGSALRLSSVLTDAPLDLDEPIEKSYCGECMQCRDTCPAGAVSGINWNVNLKRNDFYDDKKCRDYANDISLKHLGLDKLICGKCIYECPHTQKYLKKIKV